MAEELTDESAPSRAPLGVAVALLVAALAFAGWSGWQWYSAATDDSIARAQARDAALRAGKTKLEVLTSMDYRNAGKGIERWKDVSTGDLRERLTGNDGGASAIEKGGAVANSTVLGAGITELNARTGTATMIATVRIEIVERDSPATAKRNRFAAELRRTEQGWKLSGLNPIPLSGT